nr:SGNH/GDSL hydrolase family protein [Puniceicoccus vermicola]
MVDSDGYGFVGECYIGPFKHLPNILFTKIGETYRFEVEIPGWIENETIRFHFPTHCTLAIHSIYVEEENFSLPPPSRRKRWVVHGDSITQGANYSTPRMAWPDMVARELDWDAVNLGIGGFGVFDPRVAEYVASLPRDFVSIHCGANLNGKEDHRERIRQFLSIVLANGFSAPCLVVTPIVCLTRQVQPIRDQIREVVESFGIPNLRCVDGLSVVNQLSALNSDGLHLNDWGEISYYRSIVRIFREWSISSNEYF